MKKIISASKHFLNDEKRAQYREPCFLQFKKYLVTKFYFFQFHSTYQVIRRLFLPFFGKKYFTSSDPFFVMYDDRWKSFIIRAVGDIK